MTVRSNYTFKNNRKIKFGHYKYKVQHQQSGASRKLKDSSSYKTISNYFPNSQQLDCDHEGLREINRNTTTIDHRHLRSNLFHYRKGRGGITKCPIGKGGYLGIIFVV